MSLADELVKLDALHSRGALSDDEFARAKARLLQALPADAAAAASPAAAAINRLRRSSQDRWIAGVCGGLARVSGLDSWVWRLILTVLLLFFGGGALLYLLLWVFVPVDDGAGQGSG